jgi:peptidoglycan/xylan/chitin deacetylase (PgdA/CDA1 family)
MTSGRHRGLAIVLAGAALAACGRSPEGAEVTTTSPAKPSANAETTPTEVPRPKPEPKTPVTKRPANHEGAIIVAEWHHIAEGKTTMHRDPKAFRADLERLDRLGFRPVTAKAWLAGTMDLAPGASPVVMTFDDSDDDQFRLLDDGTVDPECGVGIWLDFAKTHPDFPVRGTFFVLPSLWSQPKWVEKKLGMLKEWGCEVANHTVEHVPLRKQTPERVKKEIGDAALALDRLGEQGPYTLAYPLGSTPKDLSVLKGFDWKGERIETSAAFLVGANPAQNPPPDRYRIPRIQATAGDYGLDDWLDKVEKGKVKPYVE